VGDARRHLSEALGARGDWSAAVQQAERAIEVFEALERKDPSNVFWPLNRAGAMRQRGAALAALQKRQEAERVLEAARDELRELRQSDPITEEPRRELALCLEQLAALARAAGRPGAAAEARREALDVLDGAPVQAPFEALRRRLEEGGEVRREE
jgi:tetratricopeptide (TPR) repeat protein